MLTFIPKSSYLHHFYHSTETKKIIERLIQADYLYFRGRSEWKREFEKHYQNSKVLNKTKEPLADEDFDGVIYWR
jgi:hypothetical protein